MADTKISGLPADASITGVEELALADAGTSKKATTSEMRNYVLNDAGAGVFVGKAGRWILRGTGVGVGTPAGTGKTDLKTFAVPAALLAANGDMLHFVAMFRTAANANTKRMTVEFGATILIDSTALGFNSESMRVEGYITRTGAATQVAYTAVFRNVGNDVAWSTAIVGSNSFKSPAETLANSITIKTTGQNGTAAANDIINDEFIVEFIPA
jgi:hypothetical protein